jgi:hypothetical protein
MSYKQIWRTDVSPLSALIAPAISESSPPSAPSPECFPFCISTFLESIFLGPPYPADLPLDAVAPLITFCLTAEPRALHALSLFAAANPALFLAPAHFCALTSAIPRLSHDALPHLLTVLSHLIAFDPPALAPLMRDIASAMAPKWDCRDRVHLALLRMILYSADWGAFVCVIPALVESLGGFDRAVRLEALNCLAILSQDDPAVEAMLAGGVWRAIERGFVFSDPELFAESFLLVNCLARVGWPDFLLAPEFFSRFPLVLQAVKPRGMKFVLNFLRIAIGLNEIVIIETGILRTLVDVQRATQFGSRQLIALFLAEIVSWLWGMVGTCDLFLEVFEAVAESCQNFPQDALGRWFEAADALLRECPALADVCENAALWETLLYLTEDGGETVAERAQLLLESHYWPCQDVDG